MILEKQINVRQSLENLLSAIPVNNSASMTVETVHTKFVRNAGMKLYEKLWFLDDAMKQFSTYQSVPEIKTWINETNAFFRENAVSTRAVVILEELKKSNNSNFYEAAASILEGLLTVHTEKTLPKAILDSKLVEYYWISDIKLMLENCIKITRGVDFTNPNYNVSDIYSPITVLEDAQGEGYVFSANKRVFKLDEKTGFSEYSAAALTDEFRSLIRVIENSNVTNKSISTNLNGKLIKIEETATGGRRVLLGSTEIQPSSIASTIFANASFLNSTREITERVVNAYENFDSIYNLDFAKRIESIKQKGVALNVFRFGDHIALQKININMNENTFDVYTDAEDAITEAASFIGFDLTSLFSDLVEVSRLQKAEVENKIRDIQESVAKLKSRHDNFRTAAIANNTIDTDIIQDTLKTLSESIESKMYEMDNLLPNNKKFGKMLTGVLENTNMGNQHVTFLSNDYIGDEESIKVRNGANVFYVDKKSIKIY
jgi:hypothetical protein